MKSFALRWCWLPASLLLLASCNREASTNSSTASTRRPVIVTTTTMVTDLVKQLAGDIFEIKPLMVAGVDPHLYKPSADDVAKLSKADVVVYGGLHLEGRMTEIFEHINNESKLTLALGEKLPEASLLRVSGTHFDPHIWGDAKLWAQTVPALVNTLSRAAPNFKEAIEHRGVKAQKELMELHEWLKSAVETLPPPQRVLVTSHDAFHYFGLAYGFEVVGVQGISTDSEAGLQDIARVVDLVKTRGVKAIFVESSVSPAVIQRIAKDSGAKIGGELLSDALGLPGEMVDVGDPEKVDRGTLVGMLKSNMHTIITALQP